jgi:hypothetical protein
MVMATPGPMLVSDSMLICAYGGVLKINVPGQVAVMM